MEEYFPFGKPGAGAPYRDSSGSIITSRATYQAGNNFSLNLDPQSLQSMQKDKLKHDLMLQIEEKRQREQQEKEKRNKQDLILEQKIQSDVWSETNQKPIKKEEEKTIIKRQMSLEQVNPFPQFQPSNRGSSMHSGLRSLIDNLKQDLYQRTQEKSSLESELQRINDDFRQNFLPRYQQLPRTQIMTARPGLAGVGRNLILNSPHPVKPFYQEPQLPAKSQFMTDFNYL